ncbi:iron ABC transporter permease [Marinomonas sp. TI.3.20]|uniref:ABC transporter permease n=1 Tax=Marinomonas sp. TI.3.20 TaxID=3121296 RepID=UPI00312045E4
MLLNTVSVTLLFMIIGLPVLAIILFAIFPKINELSFAAPFSQFIPQLQDERLIVATLNSTRLALAVTFSSMLVAVVLAYMRSKMAESIGRMWDVLLLIPFLIPPYIGSMGWMQLLQSNGVLDQWLNINLSNVLFSFSGVVFVITLHLFPVIYFSAASAFKVIGQRYGDVAKIYGANSRQIFSRILLPLIVPTLLSTGLIVFVLTVEEFGTPNILGSRFGFQVMVTAIEEKMSDWPIDLSGASVLSLLLVVIAISAYLLQMFITRRFACKLDNQTMTSVPSKNVWFSVVSNVIFFIVVCLAVVMPIFAIVSSSLMRTVSLGLQWDNLTFNAYTHLFFSNSDALSAIYTSLGLAAMAAVITAIIGMLVAFTLIRLKPRGKAVLDILALLPNAIPAMALSVGLILTWNQTFWPVTPYNSLLILLLAYVCLMLPYPIRMLSNAMKQLPQSLDEAAAIYGANLFVLMYKILFPLMIPIMVASSCIVFAISTRELVASLMLVPAGTETVATYVFNQFDQGSISSGMAMSFIVIVISGALIALGQYMSKRYLS